MFEAFWHGRNPVLHRAACVQAWDTSPQPDCTRLREKEGSQATEYACVSQEAVFRRCQLPVPPPPLRMAMSMVTCQRKWQGKNKAEGFLLYFFTLLPEVKCVWTDVGIPLMMNKSWDVRSWSGHWPGTSSLRAWPLGTPLLVWWLSPWSAHLPLPPPLPSLNTNSQLCCQAGLLKETLCSILSLSLAARVCPSRVKGKNKESGKGVESLWNVTGLFCYFLAVTGDSETNF